MSQHTDQFDREQLRDGVSVDELLDQLALDESEIEWRKEFVDFTEEDAARLADLQTACERRSDEVVDRFYEHILNYEQTREVIGRSPKEIDQLKRTQQEYLSSLVGGEYGQEYFADRARIGKIHDMLEMPMKQYLGQYNVYYDFFLSVVEDRIRERLAETLDAETATTDTDRLADELMSDIGAGFEELHSLLKLVTLDMQVAVDTYLQSHMDDLRLERDRFAALFENLPTPVVAVRVDGSKQQVQRVNPAFEELFGLAAEDLKEEPFEEALRPPEAEPQPIDDWTLIDPHGVTTERELMKAEITLETEFGRRQFIRVSAPIDREGLENIEYAFYMDVTDQKQRQERIQVLSRILRHDIRNQMQVIRGYTGLLREKPDNQRELVEHIEEASEELVTVTGKVRTIEEVISGKADRYPVDVTTTVESVLAEMDEQYPECQFSCQMPGEQVWVNGTEAVRIALADIVENGAEHNDADEPWVEVVVEPLEERDRVDLHVIDNGPGIPKSEYELLLGYRERSQIDHASGLGLWTVHWIVTRLGGSLQFAENTPRGSIVTLRLPCTESPESAGE